VAYDQYRRPLVRIYIPHLPKSPARQSTDTASRRRHTDAIQKGAYRLHAHAGVKQKAVYCSCSLCTHILARMAIATSRERLISQRIHL
jgi:hypothetical protein